MISRRVLLRLRYSQVKEYRAVLADLTTAPGLRGLVDDDELDVELRRLLRGGAS